MKKTIAGKVSDKSKKKELEKKIRTSLRHTEKTLVTKKKTKKENPKGKEKKRPSGKSKAGVTSKAKTVKVKTRKKQTQKSTATKKVLKPLKSAKAGTEKKTEKKSGIKAAGKTAVRKVAKKSLPKTTAKPERKIPQKKAKTGEIPKHAKKPLQKPKAKPAPKSVEISKVRKTRKVRAVRKVEKVTRAKKAIREIKTVEFIKRPGKVEKAERVTQVKVEERVEGHPSVVTEYPPTPWETLPAEYGENGITLMVVDPHKLFSFWEIREDTLKIFEGELVIRLYDITGIDFERVEAKGFTDIAVTERIGKEYIDVEPQKEYIADIGIIYGGIFTTIARSQKASTPGVAAPEGVLPPCQICETGLRIGY